MGERSPCLLKGSGNFISQLGLRRCHLARRARVPYHRSQTAPQYRGRLVIAGQGDSTDLPSDSSDSAPVVRSLAGATLFRATGSRRPGSTRGAHRQHGEGCATIQHRELGLPCYSPSKGFGCLVRLREEKSRFPTQPAPGESGLQSLL